MMNNINHRVRITANRVPIGGEVTIRYEDGQFVLRQGTEVTGEEVANSQSPLLLSSYASSHGAQIIHHKYGEEVGKPLWML